MSTSSYTGEGGISFVIIQMSQFTQACLRNATFDLLCSHMREGVKQCYDQSVTVCLSVCPSRLTSLSVILPLPEHVPYIRVHIYSYSSLSGIPPFCYATVPIFDRNGRLLYHAVYCMARRRRASTSYSACKISRRGLQ